MGASSVAVTWLHLELFNKSIKRPDVELVRIDGDGSYIKFIGDFDEIMINNLNTEYKACKSKILVLCDWNKKH